MLAPRRGYCCRFTASPRHPVDDVAPHRTYSRTVHTLLCRRCRSTSNLHTPPCHTHLPRATTQMHTRTHVALAAHAPRLFGAHTFTRSVSIAHGAVLVEALALLSKLRLAIRRPPAFPLPGVGRRPPRRARGPPTIYSSGGGDDVPLDALGGGGGGGSLPRAVAPHPRRWVPAALVPARLDLVLGACTSRHHCALQLALSKGVEDGLLEGVHEGLGKDSRLAR